MVATCCRLSDVMVLIAIVVSLFPVLQHIACAVGIEPVLYVNHQVTFLQFSVITRNHIEFK